MIFQAIILGVVQGLTEFLPISSQAHLYLVPYFLRWDYQGLGFDVVLHWGTLAAILLVFGKDYWRFLTRERQMVWYLILGSIPAAAVGLVFQKQAESAFRNPWIMVATLAGFGVLLWWADTRSKYRNVEISSGLNWKSVLLIGLFQALAIVPGVSRSGATITAALLFASMNRAQAARFSFLLSGPIIFGAGLVEFPNLPTWNTALIAGFIAAVISSIVAIKFLLRYVSTHNYSVFVWYRLASAVILMLWLVF